MPVDHSSASYWFRAFHDKGDGEPLPDARNIRESLIASSPATEPLPPDPAALELAAASEGKDASADMRTEGDETESKMREELEDYFPVPGCNYAFSLQKGDFTNMKAAKDCLFEPRASKFSVRTLEYEATHEKSPSGPSLLRFVGADLLARRGEPKLPNICALPDSLPSRVPHRNFIALNWQCPGSVPFSFVAYYVIPEPGELQSLEGDAAETRKKAAQLLERFVGEDASDEWRNSRFKLIPQIVAGPWLVRKATPSNVPALIGNKLTTTYYRGKNYFEIDVDITSSSAANTIWSLISRTLTSLVIDLAFLIQGNEKDELPEQIFGTVRIYYVKLSPEAIRMLDEE